MVLHRVLYVPVCDSDQKQSLFRLGCKQSSIVEVRDAVHFRSRLLAIKILKQKN